ncbi:hypothetical protein TRVL_01790 [Trypanosoma vivax]|nr:hypothetical protein TRVL_01790 [Trypanosoma vivax]
MECCHAVVPSYWTFMFIKLDFLCIFIVFVWELSREQAKSDGPRRYGALMGRRNYAKEKGKCVEGGRGSRTGMIVRREKRDRPPPPDLSRSGRESRHFTASVAMPFTLHFFVV